MFRTSYRFHILTALVAGALVSHITYAGEIGATALTPFSDGKPAIAAEVNGNFTTIKSAVNDNNTRINSLTTDNATNKTNIGSNIDSISALQARLDTLETQVLGTLTFPQIMTSTYRIAIAAGPGVISYSGGDNVIMGGKIVPIPSFSRNTSANKIYHLRFEEGAWKLVDVTDAAYNPSNLAETDMSFDSRSNSVLVARVIADGSNNAKVDALANKDRLQFSLVTQTGGSAASSPDASIVHNFTTVGDQLSGQIVSHQRTHQHDIGSNYFTLKEAATLNWARTPVVVNYVNNEGHFDGQQPRNWMMQIGSKDRYTMMGFGIWTGVTPVVDLRLTVGMSGSN